MPEFCGLWKYEHNQHALVPPKTECGCPSGGGIKSGHIRYGGTRGEKKCSALVRYGLFFAARHPAIEQCPGDPAEQ